MIINEINVSLPTNVGSRLARSVWIRRVTELKTVRTGGEEHQTDRTAVV